MERANDLLDEVEVVVEHVALIGTLGAARGRRVDDGRRVRFVGDRRPMTAIAEAIERGEEPVAMVPGYALGWG